MTPLEPGDKFTVGYGNGHTIQVVALSGRQKRNVIAMLEEIKSLQAESASKLRLFEIAEDAVRVCVPGLTEEQIDKMDETQQLEIVGKTIAKAALSEDEIKKSE